jgi:hypothetical protein
LPGWIRLILLCFCCCFSDRGFVFDWIRGSSRRGRRGSSPWTCIPPNHGKCACLLPYALCTRVSRTLNLMNSGFLCNAGSCRAFIPAVSASGTTRHRLVTFNFCLILMNNNHWAV